ncbi:MAG: hypothetical protein A2020_11995 [Lentisphaerae bacterium GWF2_45_14]|nr:MAG: hypothetical protein A2020_11995 [Lentisphaerae bacterium GWF2_45_14]
MTKWLIFILYNLKILLLDLIVRVFFDNFTVMKSKNGLENAFSRQGARSRQNSELLPTLLF